MRPMGKATADSLSVQSFAIIIKNTGHGNFVIGRFQTSGTCRNGLSVWDWPVHSRPLPNRHPFSDFFSEGRGRLYTGYLKRIIHLQTVCQNWRLKSGGLFIQNQNPFPFKLRRITYLTRIIKRITLLTRIICRYPFLLWWMSPLPLPWVGRSRVCFCFFAKIIFKLTIDISMRKIILKMEYFINSMIYHMLKFYQRNNFILFRDDPKTFILLLRYKKYRFINI